jgi:hypothetical protein
VLMWVCDKCDWMSSDVDDTTQHTLKFPTHIGFSERAVMVEYINRRFDPPSMKSSGEFDGAWQ